MTQTPIRHDTPARTAESASLTGIRARVMAIVLVPSIVFATAVTAVGLHLVEENRQNRAWAELVLRAAPHAVDFSEAMLQERRLAMVHVAHPERGADELRSRRLRVDAAGAALLEAAASLSELTTGAFDESAHQLRDTVRRLGDVRARADSGASTVDEVYQAYGLLTATGTIAVEALVARAPDADSAIALTTTATLLRTADAIAAVHALLAAADIDTALDQATLQAFANRVGAYHADLDSLGHKDNPTVRQKIVQLTSSPQWRQLVEFENTVVARGAASTPAHPTSATYGSDDDLPRPLSADSAAAQQILELIATGLLTLWRSNFVGVQQRATDIADNAARTSTLTVLAALIIAIATFVLTSWLASGLIRRLRRLRLHTLAVADTELPAILARINAGETVELDSVLPPTDFGDDEIGELAEAFDTAQRAAVSAAMAEVRTRGAVNAIFLNLAHRSQAMAYRQLEVLDAAEAHEEDPDKMELLFELDHLATRERRNAENLIILGGERPGRQWRHPVTLSDVVRGAITESKDYTRVALDRFPDVSVDGEVVADVIHLLAELIENATYFSSATAPVTVSGGLVRGGAVVEVADRGRGMSRQELNRVNRILGSAPDFGLMHLSSDARMGLIVVSILAGRNQIEVRLTESDHGGVKAIVFLPLPLLDDRSAVMSRRDSSMIASPTVP
ncbi:nitrate- and nitrite sensing domain-containing protein [Nocardia sp. AG03]|uniref:nitrate- and nitrite sensing domain-containing protein n=1 Tax=Nocardia sp. AG03 TaxID=3025312 RepID=UPI0024184462|nr:nitrate- and nitrite sensing domain-containing protein [Nocardia sp. AG03]